jgi:hypothetical protein
MALHELLPESETSAPMHERLVGGEHAQLGEHARVSVVDA